MRTLLTAALLTLASCGQTGADGYEFGNATFVADTATVSVITYGSQAELRAVAQRQGVRAEGGDLMAWATVNPSGHCTIHIVEPARTYRPEWLGHEFTHCIRGDWHP